MQRKVVGLITLLQSSLTGLLTQALILVIIFVLVSGVTPASETAPEPRHITPLMMNAAEKRFAELGYWTGGIEDKNHTATRYAVLAFQRVEGRKQTGELSQVEMEAIGTASRPKPLETGYPHIEVDLKRQVLFVIDASSTVSMILPISSGSGKFFTVEGRTHRAVTPRGRFKVYRKIQGWRRSALGLLYYPNYLVEGVAIHGSPQIPNYPASHGCIRIPIPASKDLSDVTPVGTVVIVHDGNPKLPVEMP